MTAVTDAAVSRLTTAGAPRVYEFGKVPVSPDYPYAVVSAGIGAPMAYNNAAQHGARRHRLNVQGFGRTVNEVVRTLERADTAFLDQALTEVDEDVTPCIQDLATEPARDPDAGGVIYALVSYTFTTGSN